MTRKEDDAIAGPTGDSSYCSRHRLYYGIDASCPRCRHEEIELKRGRQAAARVQKCPACGETSLFYYQCSDRWECLNIDCKLGHAEAGY